MGKVITLCETRIPEMVKRFLNGIVLLIYVYCAGGLESYGSFYAAQTRNATLRPIATRSSIEARSLSPAKSSSAGNEDVDPYELAPLDDEDVEPREFDADDMLLIRGLSLPKDERPTEGEKPQDEESETKLDGKIDEALHRAQRRAAEQKNKAGQTRITADETGQKMQEKTANQQFIDFWAQRVQDIDAQERKKGVGLPGIAMPKAQPVETKFDQELKSGFGASLGAITHLGEHFEVQAAIAEVAKEEGASTSKKIEKILTALTEINDPHGLFYKALGYLQYATQIGCDKAQIEILYSSISEYRTNPAELKYIARRILELIKETAKVLERNDAIRRRMAVRRKELPLAKDPQALYGEAKANLQYALKLGCDKTELRRLYKKLKQNRGNLEEIKKLSSELLSLIEIASRPDSVKFAELPQAMAGKTSIISDEEQFGSIDQKIWNGIRHAKFVINNFCSKWTKRIHKTPSYQGVSALYFDSMIDEAHKLLSDESIRDYAGFHLTAFNSLKIGNIIQLEKTKGSLRTYIIVGVLQGRKEEGSYTTSFLCYIKPLTYTKRTTKPEPLRESDISDRPKVFQVKTYQEIREAKTIDKDTGRPQGYFNLRLDASKGIVSNGGSAVAKGINSAA